MIAWLKEIYRCLTDSVHSEEIKYCEEVSNVWWGDMTPEERNDIYRKHQLDEAKNNGLGY